MTTISKHLNSGFDIEKPNFIRPPCKGVDGDLIFFMMTMTFTSQKTVNYKPVLFGVTDEGHSVYLEVSNFMTHFYVQIDDSWGEREISKLLHYLVVERIKKQYLLSYIFTKRERHGKFYGFNNDAQFTFIKFSFKNECARETLLRELWKKQTIPDLKIYDHQFTPIEHNIPWENKFLEGQDLSPSSFLRIPQGKYNIIDTSPSSCQINVKCMYADLEQYEKEDIPPFVCASLDIECAGRRGYFPDPNVPDDKVIMIATSLYIFGNGIETTKTILHTIKNVNEIENTDVLCYASESELLKGWQMFWNNLSPDVFIGYNIFGFDSRYMFTRAVMNNIDAFKILGKVFDLESKLVKKTLSSKAYSHIDMHVVEKIGIFQLDVLVYLQTTVKLRSYKLGAASEHFLGDQKEDMPYQLITPYWEENDEKRTIVARYCVKDTMLPLQLVLSPKLKILESLIASSRITYLPLEMLFGHGEGPKFISIMSRHIHAAGKLMDQPPNHKENMDKMKTEELEFNEMNERRVKSGLKKMKADSSKGYKGGSVLEPKTGFYDVPIPTLDFASLYPSIMIAENLCPSTLVLDEKYLGIENIEYEKMDILNGDVVAKSVYVVKNRKGITVSALQHLLQQRSKYKKLMAEAEKRGDKDSVYKNNQFQLKCKLAANSFYGSYGAKKGKLPCVEVSALVTSTGRKMIIMAKNHVLETYHGSEVIYGDTDSIMIKFKVDKSQGKEKMFDEVFKLAQQASESATKLYKKPHNLEFEKVYYPYFLFDTKKTYIGGYYTDPRVRSHIDVKGLKTVRREPAPIVTNLGNLIIEQLVDVNIEKALLILIEYLDDLVEEKIPFEDFIKYEGLSKPIEHYKQYTAHVELAKRLRDRDPNNCPVSGSRFPYVAVLTETSNQNKKKGEFIEDPDYARKHGMKLDYAWYIEHELAIPISKILSLNVDCLPLFKEYATKMRNKQEGTGSLLGLFGSNASAATIRQNKVRKLLGYSAGSRVRPTPKKRTKSQSILSFLQKTK